MEIDFSRGLLSIKAVVKEEKNDVGILICFSGFPRFFVIGCLFFSFSFFFFHSYFLCFFFLSFFPLHPDSYAYPPEAVPPLVLPTRLALMARGRKVGHFDRNTGLIGLSSAAAVSAEENWGKPNKRSLPIFCVCTL